MYSLGMPQMPTPKRIIVRAGAIYDARKTLDVSRDELARRMGVTGQTAYRVDAGYVDPSPAFIAALMDITGKTFEDLFEIVDREQVAV